MNGNHTSALDSGNWRQRERAVRAFELAWQEPARPVLDAFLPAAGEERRAVLGELIQVELELRLKAGESARVEDYLQRYPELGSDAQALLDLIASEWEWRRRREPGLERAEFAARFPHLTAEGLDSACPLSPVETVDDPRARLADPEATVDRAFQAVPTAGQRLGQYELLEVVGRGAFGAVYRARDTELDRIVAVKVLRPESLDSAEEQDRFFREARSAAQLRHPNIVAVYGSGRIGDTFYIASAFIEGHTLHARLKEGRLPIRAAVELLAAVADALDHAHNQGVIHRDIKPANILLDADDRPHVADFGLARRETGEITLTVEGQILGTPAYMPPEQARGEGHLVGARGDVYSLGVVLYELLTGELPFRGNVRMVLQQVQSEEPRPPRRLNDTLPRDLETVCLKAMAKEAGSRYATAGEFAEELRRFLRGEPVRARRLGPLGKWWRWSRRKPALAATAVLGVLLFAVLAVGTPLLLLAWQGEQKQRNLATQRLQDYLRQQPQLDESRRQAQELLAAFVQLTRNPMLRQPGLQGLRAELLDRVQVYYQDFLERSEQFALLGDEDRSFLQQEQATALVALGQVACRRGDWQRGERAYERAVAGWRQSLARQPSEPARLGLAQALTGLGSMRNSRGRHRDALHTLQEARSLWQELQRESGSATILNELLECSMLLAQLHTDMRQPEQAARLWEESRPVLAQLSQLRPDDVGLKGCMARSYLDQGNRLMEQGDPEKARQVLERALGVLTALMVELPDVPALHIELAHCRLQLGRLRNRKEVPGAEDQAAAVALFQRGAAGLRRLIQESPGDVALVLQLARAQQHVGICLAQRRPDEAITALEEAARLLEQLMREQPRSAHFAAMLALVRCLSSQAHLAAGRPAEARRASREAGTVLERLEAGLTDEERAELPHAYRDTGWMLVLNGQPDEGVRLCRKAIALWQPMSERLDDVEHRLLLSGTWQHVSDGEHRLGRPSEAVAALRTAVQLSRTVHERFPQRHAYRRGYSRVLESLARLHRELGQLTTAAELLRERAKLWANDQGELYHLGLDWQYLAGAVGKGRKELTPQERAEQDAYQKEAVTAFAAAAGSVLKSAAPGRE